jgi:uncharacterized protein (DUF1697 family)
MPKYIAFLRAINVGGHTVKMDHLRQVFESLGFLSVETFIASGNVVFETPAKNASALERKIEAMLHKALGYEVATFMRTISEVAEIVNSKLFTEAEMKAATAFNIAFLAEPPDAKAKQKVMALKTDIDTFHVHGRELYWLCRKKQSESTFSNAVLEKALGKPSTIRGANTVKKIAEKYSR